MRQPKPDTMDYPELLGQVESGMIKIPDFQRPVVWDIGQTVYLLDSISKGFPIGSLIFWQSHERMRAHRNVGDLPLAESPEGRVVNYVLDGQQRLTSLYAALKGATISGRQYRVFCDLDSEPDGDVFSLDCPDVSRFVDLKELLGENQHLVYDGLTPPRKKRFNSIREAFRLYKFSTIRIEDQPLDVVCEIFTRINNTGTELDLFDLMVAKTWSASFNLRDAYNDLVSDLEAVRYEGLGSSAVVQAISCILKGGCTRKQVLSIRREEMGAVWPESADSIKLAVDFLRNQIGIPSWRLLPYPSTVAVLSYFFHKNDHRQPNSTQTRLLSRYFWRTSLSERYTSGTESKIGSDLQGVESTLKEDDRCFLYPYALNDDDLIRCEHSMSNAFSKTILAYLASRRPENFENNGYVTVDNSSLSRSNSRHFHHFFPKKHLQRKGAPFQRSNSVVNICLVPAESNLHYHDNAPRDYLAPLMRSNPRLGEALVSHDIGDLNEFGITDDDYDKFLKARATRIRDGLESLYLSFGEFDDLYGAGNEEFPSDSNV